MATIKTVLRPYKNNEGKQQITIRVSHQGKTCFHPTGEYILAKYFSTKGIYEGAEETLKLVEKYSNGGLKSTLDWETTQRLLKEQISKN